MSTITPLLSSAAYGVSDYLGGVAARRMSSVKVIAISYPTSAVGMAVLAMFVPGEATREGLLWGAGSGLIMAFAIWWFYDALAAGPISFVSPATAVIVAGLPVTVGLMKGERPVALAWLGIVLGFFAVLLVSRSPTDDKNSKVTRRTLMLTAGAGVAFALSFVLTAEIPEGSGLVPLVAARVAATAVVFAVLVPRTRGSNEDEGVKVLLPVVIGLIDIVANVAMYYTFQSGDLAIGSIIIALYPAFTVGLAVLILREQVSKTQTAGLLAATASILLVTYATSG